MKAVLALPGPCTLEKLESWFCVTAGVNCHQVRNKQLTGRYFWEESDLLRFEETWKSANTESSKSSQTDFKKVRKTVWQVQIDWHVLNVFAKDLNWGSGKELHKSEILSVALKSKCAFSVPILLHIFGSSFYFNIRVWCLCWCFMVKQISPWWQNSSKLDHLFPASFSPFSVAQLKVTKLSVI